MVRLVPGSEWEPQGEMAQLALRQAELLMESMEVDGITAFGTELVSILHDIQSLRRHLEAVLHASLTGSEMPPYPDLGPLSKEELKELIREEEHGSTQPGG